jgi:hypothetical protein
MLQKDKIGRLVLGKNNNRSKPLGYIILKYECRALEWLNFRKLFEELLSEFNFDFLKHEVKDVVFAWQYHKHISTYLYKPAMVFKQFSFIHLLDHNETCVCTSAKRFQHYLDSRTMDEQSSYAKQSMHVRTTDVNIIQHPELRKIISQGLNHIPLRPTSIKECIDTVLHAFEQLSSILHLYELDFPFKDATEWLTARCQQRLQFAARKNLYEFRFSGTNVLENPSVQNELRWITQHLFCAGLDKAANNCCFVCVKHIRLMALERLSSSDFLPCKDDDSWLLPTHMLDKITADLSNIVPELEISHQALPYLMATYKQHKNKYRWITNAFQTVFSSLGHLITIATMLILDSVQEWAAEKAATYATFLKVHTSLYWLVNSAIEVALNMPQQISDIYVADIRRCYESIPLEGDDNLHDAMTHLIKRGFAQQKKHLPRSSPLIWVRVNAEGEAAKAIWATSAPQYGSWFFVDANRLIQLHGWLMRNCFVALGDRVWQQVSGIPMGFSCSPL